MKDFKVKFEVEDEFHDFMKSLPKGMRQTITFNVKSEAANENAKQLLGMIAKTALQDIELGVQFKANEDELINSFRKLSTVLRISLNERVRTGRQIQILKKQ